MPNPAIPTVSDVEYIAAQDDPVMRNLRITQCYHELALAMVDRCGWNANWCTFATWASRQAGQTIRKEDLARTLEHTLGNDPDALRAAEELAVGLQQVGIKLGVGEIVRFVWKVLDPDAAIAHSSEAVARGNLKVFAEIGREFARFYAACLDDPVYDGEKIAHFCQELRAGNPPDGQGYLQEAFVQYYEAFFQQDIKARVELLLLANLQIGYHEQTRLQPEINEALVAALITPEAFTRNFLKALRPNWGRLKDMIWYVMRLFGRLTALDTTIATLLEAAQRQTQFLVTESMMTIELPPNTLLRLGDDLSVGFPAILQKINNPNLRALLAKIDPTPDSLDESGAQYWGDLPDRLHFIADMFRCYQTAEALFEPPFSPDQTMAIKAAG
jgi:hypothetical protein